MGRWGAAERGRAETGGDGRWGDDGPRRELAPEVLLLQVLLMVAMGAMVVCLSCLGYF